MTSWRLKTLGAALVASALVALPIAAAEDVSEYRAKMEKWVETRQILSKERSDWEVERQSLRATRDLLAGQKKAFEEQIAELEAASSAADDERRELLLQRGELQRTRQVLEAEIGAMEAEIITLSKQLPEPLRKKLEPLLVQIPEDPENTRQPVGQRLMNVLGVLAQAEKFNGTATFVGETRSVGGAEKVSVRTLYWGLGQAFYVDSQGQTAGVGRPGSDGWTFTNQPELARDAKLLLDIYEGNVDVIEFVTLPVEIQ